MALLAYVKKVVWMRMLLKDLGCASEGATISREDNQGAIALANNVGCESRTRYINLRYHYV